MIKATDVSTSIDPSKLSLTGLSAVKSLSPLGGSANVYSNGVMTAKVWVAWQYSDDGTVNASDVENYLKADGNLTWGFVESYGVAGDPLSERSWTVSAEDNGYEHDYMADVSSQPSQAAATGTAFYILPDFGDDKPGDVYCCLTADPTVTTLKDPTYTVHCAIWSFGIENFSFDENDIDQGHSGLTLKQLCYKDADASGGPAHKLTKWLNFHPRASDQATSSDAVHVPFDAGYDSQLLAILYSANDDREDYGRMVYLLQNDEDLGKTLTSFHPSDFYYSNENYYFLDVFGVPVSGSEMYGFSDYNNSWPDSVMGVLMGIRYGRWLDYDDHNGGRPNVLVNSYHDNGYHYVDLSVEDNFGTRMKFHVHLDGTNCTNPIAESVSIIEP